VTEIRKPQVNLSSIKISFADDTLDQLPEVVRTYHGVFALIDRRDPAFARYLIEPPDWTVREALEDTSGSVRFAISPADRWAEIREAARRYPVDLSKYDVFAMFGQQYIQCVQQAILSRAMVLPGKSTQAVDSARLVFAAASPCGVNVLDIEMVPLTVAKR
jgi:hypothetical protein